MPPHRYGVPAGESHSPLSVRRDSNVPSGGPPSNHSTIESNYLTAQSDFLGPLEYDASCMPEPISELKHLQFPLSKEAFCSYRPSVMELYNPVISRFEFGPPVNLVDPNLAYPIGSPVASTTRPEGTRSEALAGSKCLPPTGGNDINLDLASHIDPEDLALVAGLVPGLERVLRRSPAELAASTTVLKRPLAQSTRTAAVTRPQLPPQRLMAPTPTSTLSPEERVAQIELQFQKHAANKRLLECQPSATPPELPSPGDAGDDAVHPNPLASQFVHPSKPNLRPVKVLPVLPNMELQESRYMQVALQHMDPKEWKARLPLFLKPIDSAGGRLKGFSVFQLDETEVNNTACFASHAPASSLDGLAVLPKLDGAQCRYVRDYVAQIPDAPVGNFSILLELPPHVQLNPLQSSSTAALPVSSDSTTSVQNCDQVDPSYDRALNATYPTAAAFYCCNLFGSKVLFTKSSTSQRHRFGSTLRLITYAEPVPAEAADATS